MPKPNNKTKTKRSIEFWVVGVLLLALFFVFLYVFGENGLLRIGELRRLRLSIAKEIARFSYENERLSREVIGLKEDTFYIEKFAREELHLVRPNEVIFHRKPSEDNPGKDR